MAAGSLSLHSGRVWLANALTAIAEPVPTIQRFCRWRSEESVLVYQRIGSKKYTATILKAIRADISGVHQCDVPTTDFDSYFSALEEQDGAGVLKQGDEKNANA